MRVYTPFGVPTFATLLVGLGLVAGGIVPQEVIHQIPSEQLSDWIGPPGVLILLYETVRRGLAQARKLRDEVTALQERQKKIVRDLGINFDDDAP